MLWIVTDKLTGNVMGEYLSEREARHLIDDYAEVDPTAPLRLEIKGIKDEEN